MKLSALTLAARKRGVSLIEGVLYLVIALAVIVGGIVFFQQAQLSNSVTDTARATVGISSQVRALYQNQRSFGEGDITGAVISSGSVPSNFLNAAGDGIVTPFGGSIQVFGNNKTFAIRLNEMTTAACLRLATVGEGGDSPLGTGILGMTYDDDVQDDPAIFDSALTLELDPAEQAPINANLAAAACDVIAPGELRDVTVFYSR